MWKVKKVFIKWSLNLFNLLIFLIGLSLVASGVMLQTVFKYDHAFVSLKMSTISNILLIVGLFIVILAVIGCISLLPNCVNPMMAGFFITGLMIATIALGCLGGFIYSQFDTFIHQAKSEISDNFGMYKEKYSHLQQTQEINLLQTRFKCCGLNSYEDWKKTSNDPFVFQNKNKLLLHEEQISFDLPDTCCMNITLNCGKDFRFVSTIHTNGCYTPFFKYLTERILTIGCVSVGMAFVNFLTILFLVFVCSTLKGDYSLIATSSKK